MAIKTSNQITFTEQKKVKQIKEWYLATNQETDVTVDTDGWTDTVQKMNETNKYLWNYEEVIYSIGPSEKSEPIVIGFYGQGTDGKGIADIKNYYLITSTPELPESPKWSDTVLMLTSTNKYLWNYDDIIYTDNTYKSSDPIIIGVYGDSGTDAVDFQIYSVDGFEFSDTLTSIELKTVAFRAGSQIEDSSVTYQWKWWNTSSSLDDKYEAIQNATSSSLTVSAEDMYAFSSIKCEMTCDDIVYEDYITLTEKTIIYAATVKFFNGSNVIDANNDYLIAYVELYKDNVAEELVYTTTAYKSDSNTVQNEVINTDLSGEYTNDDAMYFICTNKKQDVIEYDVVLGKYDSGQWKVSNSNYIYKNDVYPTTTSNVFIIPKNKIARTLDITVEVYNNVLDENGLPICDNQTIVARTNALVMDLNDPIINNTQPSNPEVGQLWLDTSASPSILKMWDGSEWVNSGYQNGNVVYTSKPVNGYSEGDLWILADEETCGDFSSGSMLKANTTSATFNESHWEDVDEEVTEQKKNIKQYFLFNKDTGLRIGQSDDKFYVNISSTEMGFYDASDGTAKKVVSIGNKSATIKNLTVEENAIFNCEVQFGEFILKTESNGSLSLAIAT